MKPFSHFGFPAELWKTRGWRRRRGCRISCRCRRPAQSCPTRPTPSCKTEMISFHLEYLDEAPRGHAYLGELVAHDGVLLGEVHDAEGELESGVGLLDDNDV